MQVHRAASIRRVYFLGAGFSCGMGYPPAPRLLDGIVTFLREKKGHSRETGKRRIQMLIECIGSFSRKYFCRTIGELGRIPIADFFSLIYSMHTGKFPIEEKEYSKLYGPIAATVRSYFNDLWKSRNQIRKNILSVLDSIDPDRHAVVSFNWDEQADTFLTVKGPDVIYTLDGWKWSEGFLLLKPHGSIGWYDIGLGLGNEEMYFVAGEDRRVSRLEKRMLSFTELESPVDFQRDRQFSFLDAPPLITPPTFSKVFEYPEQKLIWKDVFEVCRRARQFIFLGYSFPGDDMVARAAFTGAINRNPYVRKGKATCVVVDRSADGKRGDADAFGRLFDTYNGLFGGRLGTRNFLGHTFGSPPDRKLKSTLMKLIERKLETAAIRRSG